MLRTKQNADPPFELVRCWRDDGSYSFNSICWTQDTEGRPLLCAAGSTPRSILIYSIEADKPIRTLAGHGKAINDLQISPIAPNILASASEDYSIRIWNLDPEFEQQPCVMILAGQGHRQPLLALEFHPNGRWLLSGGMDTAIAVWDIPPLPELNDTRTKYQEPRLKSYPCFFSEEIHTNYVDCLKWYGDAILSRAALPSNTPAIKNELLLWQIDGFNSNAAPPALPPIPYPGKYSRSAFPHAAESRGFHRLLTFKTDNTGRFYLRFGLYHEPDKRPILVMGNTISKFLFWDLQRCEEGEDPPDHVRTGRGGRGGRGRGRGGLNTESLDRLGGLKRDSSVASSDGTSGKLHNTRIIDNSLTHHPIAFQTNRSSSNTNTNTTTNTPVAHTSASVSASNAPENGTGKKSSTDDPIRALRPHCERNCNTSLIKEHFATNQLGWSPDGRWLIGVGDKGMMVVFYRAEVA